MQRSNGYRIAIALLLSTFLTGVSFAQTTSSDTIAQREREVLNQAQLALTAAEQAGAPAFAKSLYDEAAFRLRTAQENWSSSKASAREEARLRANEALWAARAALAKARWIGTNSAIRGLQADITRFGGRSDVTVTDEPPLMAMDRGTTSKDRVAVAQAAIDAAKAVGGEQFAGDDLKTAQQTLESAKKIARVNKNSETADYLAYVAEMTARRAFYLAKASESGRYLPGLQLERTRFAQAESERLAAAERTQREAAQRQAEELQRQLAAEQANRQSQQEQLQQLQQQVELNRQTAQQQIEADRAARREGERRLDEVMARYEAAISSGSAGEAESLRRQVEDQQIALRAIQEREKLNEQAMQSQIERLRADLENAQKQGTASSQLLGQRQAELQQRELELQQLRKEREADIAHRTETEKAQQAAIAEATAKRQAAEAQAQALVKQVEAAQQATQQAQQAAQASQAEAEKAKQQAQAAQTELEKTRQELAEREVEARRMRLQNELTKVANTTSNDRGIIVTLPGIFFDTGKTTLKPGAKSTLRKIADQLKNGEDIRVNVEGHTDGVGTEEKNLALSQRRAEAVRDFLVSVGVPDDRVMAVGKGEREPIATNKTAAGRQQNRRVELVINQ